MHERAPTLLVVSVAVVVAGLLALVLDEPRSAIEAVVAPTSAPTTSTSTTTTSPPATDPPTTVPVAPPVAAPPAADVVPIGVVETPSGIVTPVVTDRGDGTYEVQTPCDARAVVPGERLGGIDVVLDPGHGGSEPGAVGPNGLTEKELNLAVAQRTAAHLRDAGLRVLLTREVDVRLTLAHRANVAVGLRPAAFVSIHHNAAPDGPSSAPGTEAYFQVASAESRRLTGLVVEEVRAALAPFGLAWASDLDNGGRARIRPGDGADFYGILRRSAGVPAVLSEAAFLSNPPEADLLATEAGQEAEAQAIARAIIRFLAGESAGDGAFSPNPPSTGASGGPGGGPAGCVDPPLT